MYYSINLGLLQLFFLYLYNENVLLVDTKNILFDVSFFIKKQNAMISH